MASNALIAAGFTPCSDPDCREVHSKKMDALLLRCIFTSRLNILNMGCYGCTPSLAISGGFQTLNQALLLQMIPT